MRVAANGIHVVCLCCLDIADDRCAVYGIIPRDHTWLVQLMGCLTTAFTSCSCTEENLENYPAPSGALYAVLVVPGLAWMLGLLSLW